MRADRLRETLSGCLRESLGGGTPVRLRVRRGSMRPLLRPGDQILVEGMCTDCLRIGDLALFESGSDLVVHRYILPLRGGRLLTKGDFRFHFDPPRRSGDLLGRVRSVERGGSVLRMRKGLWGALNPVLGGVFLLQGSAFRLLQEIRGRMKRGVRDRDAGMVSEHR